MWDSYSRSKGSGQDGGSWETQAAEEVIRAVGMQSAATYIGRRQATVSQWVALQPLLEVLMRETGYEGGVRKRQPWWRHGTTLEVLRITLEEAS